MVKLDFSADFRSRPAEQSSSTLGTEPRSPAFNPNIGPRTGTLTSLPRATPPPTCFRPRRRPGQQHVSIGAAETEGGNGGSCYRLTGASGKNRGRNRLGLCWVWGELQGVPMQVANWLGFLDICIAAFTHIKSWHTRPKQSSQGSLACHRRCASS